MLKKVVLALNPLEPETWTTHEVEDVCAFLKTQFVVWPETARIYEGSVSQATDITPSTESDILRLAAAQGTIYVINFPGLPAAWIYYVVAALVVAVVMLATQKIPNSALRNTQSTSPNNELSERTNKPRPNGRIPDVFGTVRSTPDLIAVPYKLFENHQEVEHAYMCIGRGYYDVSDIRDDTTLSSNIAGTSVEVYAPFTSPNSGDLPQYSVGDPIDTQVLSVARSNSVNGQVMRPPNDQKITGNLNIRFITPNQVELLVLTDLDFTKEFEAGDEIDITNAYKNSGYASETKTIFASNTGYFRFAIPSSTLPPEYTAGLELTLFAALFNVFDSDGFISATYDLSGVYSISNVTHTLDGIQDYCNIWLTSPVSVNPQWDGALIATSTDAVLKIPSGAELFNLSGTYEILTVSEHLITLVSPELVNANWSTITTTDYVSPTLSVAGDRWIGPFILAQKTLNEVYANFVAANGLYKDDGNNQTSVEVMVELEVTPINNDGTPRGSAELFQTTVTGSSKLKSTRASTLKCFPALLGRCSVRARRVTLRDLEFKGTVVDEIKWRDLYAVSPVADLNFGNVTTVQSVTYATDGALAIKERKLNMLVTRKIPLRVSGSTFTTELYATNKAEEIIAAACLDPKIGNRNANEIDFDSIYNTLSEVRGYFGTDLAGEFNYTLDSNNFSFEETITSIADAVFCVAYRRGNIIKLNFEKETDNSTLLFNHRNKLPNTETRSVRFGNEDNVDGVSFEYVDPEDDALITYYIPEDRSAVNPKEIESIGVRSRLQAHFHAWRIWNKARHRNTVVEFTGTQEADLLVRNDRILIADNTRSETQDGQIEEQSGLLLTLSNAVEFAEEGNTIFVQYADETVESITATPGPKVNQVVLAAPPRVPLVLDDDFYAKTTFVLVGNTDTGENAFLVTEKSPQGNQTSTVRAINYDGRYYENDNDFINGVIDSDGNFV